MTAAKQCMPGWASRATIRLARSAWSIALAARRDLAFTACTVTLVAFTACAGSTSSSLPSSAGGGSGGSAGISADGGVSSPPGVGSGTGAVTGSGGSVAAGGPSGASTGGATVSGTGGSSAGSGGVGCLVNLTPVSPASLDNLTAGSDARVRLHAAVSGGTRAAKWTWTVLRVPVGSPVPITSTADPSTIEFPITMAGGYSARVFVDVGFNCTREQRLVVKDPEPNALVFSVSPPDSLMGAFPAQRLTVAVKAANPSAIALELRAGTPIRILPQDGIGQTLSSFVRVRALSGASSVDGYTDRGPVAAVLLPWPGETYEVLVVPDELVAPQLFGTSDLIATSDQLVTLAMSPGIRIDGMARDSAGSPVLDTRVVLRAGTRPSTVGATDSNGEFSLWTRPGVHSAVFAPPPGSGLPEAHLATDPGIAVSTADSAMTMSLTWAHFTMAPVTLRVRSSDNLSDIVGASVSIESEAELPNVGTVSLAGASGSASTLTVSGAVRARATSDGTGMARFPTIPLGTYAVAIASSKENLTTRVSLVVGAGGVSRSIPLAPPVTLSGRLLPAGQSTGVLVIARDQNPGAAAAMASTATADSMGRYRLVVAAGRTYELEADPAGVPGLARTVLGTVDVTAPDQVAPDFAVEVGVAFNGLVKTAQSGVPISAFAGAVVQAFCPGPSATCLAPGRPIAEAVTRSDGTFRLVLPSSLVR